MVLGSAEDFGTCYADSKGWVSATDYKGVVLPQRVPGQAPDTKIAMGLSTR